MEFVQYRVGNSEVAISASSYNFFKRYTLAATASKVLICCHHISLDPSAHFAADHAKMDLLHDFREAGEKARPSTQTPRFMTRTRLGAFCRRVSSRLNLAREFKPVVDVSTTQDLPPSYEELCRKKEQDLNKRFLAHLDTTRHEFEKETAKKYHSGSMTQNEIDTSMELIEILHRWRKKEPWVNGSRTKRLLFITNLLVSLKSRYMVRQRLETVMVYAVETGHLGDSSLLQKRGLPVTYLCRFLFRRLLVEYDVDPGQMPSESAPNTPFSTLWAQLVRQLDHHVVTYRDNSERTLDRVKAFWDEPMRAVGLEGRIAQRCLGLVLASPEACGTLPSTAMSVSLYPLPDFVAIGEFQWINSALAQDRRLVNIMAPYGDDETTKKVLDAIGAREMLYRDIHNKDPSNERLKIGRPLFEGHERKWPRYFCVGKPKRPECVLSKLGDSHYFRLRPVRAVESRSLHYSEVEFGPGKERKDGLPLHLRLNMLNEAARELGGE